MAKKAALADVCCARVGWPEMRTCSPVRRVLQRTVSIGARDYRGDIRRGFITLGKRYDRSGASGRLVAAHLRATRTGSLMRLAVIALSLCLFLAGCTATPKKSTLRWSR